MYFSNPNEGPHQVPLHWPQYDPENGKQYLIESVEPWTERETPEFIEEMNWYLYEFWPLLRPAWEKNSTHVQSLDGAGDDVREPISEAGGFQIGKWQNFICNSNYVNIRSETNPIGFIFQLR